MSVASSVYARTTCRCSLQSTHQTQHTPESLPAAAPVTLRYRAGFYFKMPFKPRCCSRARGALTQFKCTNARKCWLTNRPKCEHTLEQFYSGMYSILQQKTIPQLGLKIARACATIFKGRPGLNCISTIVGLLRMKYSRSRR